MAKSTSAVSKEPRMVRAGKLPELYGLSAVFWQRLRSNGEGPAYLKLGEGQTAPILYDLNVVEAWLASHQRNARHQEQAA